MESKFRKLRADEIECRIATVKKDGSGLSLLLYSNATAVQTVLDESVGCMNWKRIHPSQNREFCIVSIYDEEKQQWVEKEDVGTESFAEKEKGQASDSFKRACANWGIGRELRSAPAIWVKKPDCNTYLSKDKYTSNDKFYVSHVDYDKDKITKLEIKNAKTHKVVYRLGDIEQEEPVSADVVIPGADDMPMSEPKKKVIRSLCKKHGIPVDGLYKQNGLTEDTATERDAAKFLATFKHRYGDE